MTSLMMSQDLRHRAVGGAKTVIIKVASVGDGPSCLIRIRIVNLRVLLRVVTNYGGGGGGGGYKTGGGACKI